MDMKRPRVMAIYRAGSPQPSAAIDQRILAAARERQTSGISRGLALAAAVALVAIFAARWMMPGQTSAPEITDTHFGLEEGQARAWLTSYQPTLTATGPGSQEGLTP
jgi:hypothetical protein